MKLPRLAAAWAVAFVVLLAGGCQTTGTTKPITRQESQLAFNESAKLHTRAIGRENYSTSQVQVDAYHWQGGHMYYIEAFPGRLFRVYYSDADGLQRVVTHQLEKLKLDVSKSDVAFSSNRFGSFPYVVATRPDGQNCFVFSQTLEYTTDDATSNKNPSRVYAYGYHCSPPATLDKAALKTEMLKVTESLRKNR